MLVLPEHWQWLGRLAFQQLIDVVPIDVEFAATETESLNDDQLAYFRNGASLHTHLRQRLRHRLVYHAPKRSLILPLMAYGLLSLSVPAELRGPC